MIICVNIPNYPNTSETIEFLFSSPFCFLPNRYSLIHFMELWVDKLFPKNFEKKNCSRSAEMSQNSAITKFILTVISSNFYSFQMFVQVHPTAFGVFPRASANADAYFPRRAVADAIASGLDHEPSNVD